MVNLFKSSKPLKSSKSLNKQHVENDRLNRLKGEWSVRMNKHDELCEMIELVYKLKENIENHTVLETHYRSKFKPIWGNTSGSNKPDPQDIEKADKNKKLANEYHDRLDNYIKLDLLEQTKKDNYEKAEVIRKMFSTKKLPLLN
jgi:hypothetical protein